MALNGKSNSNDNFVRHTFPVTDILNGDQISFLIVLLADFLDGYRSSQSKTVFPRPIDTDINKFKRIYKYNTCIPTCFLGPEFAHWAGHEHPGHPGHAALCRAPAQAELPQRLLDQGSIS